MLRNLRRPSPALIISLVALFVSLGGVSYGVATGSIDSREIKNNTVRSKDIRNSQVLSRDIRNSTVRGRDVATNTLGGVDINESTLGLIPNAGHASSADNASTAASAVKVNSVNVVPAVTAAPGQTKSLVKKGPLTLQLRCIDNGGGDIGFVLQVDTSVNNASIGSIAVGGPDDLDAADAPAVVSGDNGTTQTVEESAFSAVAPGGQFQGFGMVTAKTGGSNKCSARVVLIG
jgi:hypothetical protein